MFTAYASPGCTVVCATRNVLRPIRPWRLTSSGEHITEGDLGRGLDGAAVVDASAARWGWRRRLCERGAGHEQGPCDNESGNGRAPSTLRASAEEEVAALEQQHSDDVGEQQRQCNGKRLRL